MLILDRLLTGLKDACAAFPDKRKGEGVYSMADIGLSAFSLFFMRDANPFSLTSAASSLFNGVAGAAWWRSTAPSISARRSSDAPIA